MSTFKLFNSLTLKEEPIDPIRPPEVGLYACGPTVYNYAHIGNFRTYVFVDLLRRSLEFFGYKVKHVMQMTDVDDKTIRDSKAEGTSLADFTQRYTRAFEKDMATLNILPPHIQPNATEHIPQMITLIERLIANGSAYQSEDGSVYFRVRSFERYGCLCHIDLAGLQSGARVSQDEYDKEAVGDFVLWKKWTEADGVVGWESPWGKGRPGWHIECSAMSMQYLGEQFDIHCGGVDLKFPHHDNEIAQSEAATGKQFVRHWAHSEHLMVDNQKMSKRDGNLYTVKDVEERGFSGRELRYALQATTRYRVNLNFTWKGMEDAKLNVSRLDEWRHRFKDNVEANTEPDAAGAEFLAKFSDAIADDLNVPSALGHLLSFVRESNKRLDAGEAPAGLATVWAKVDSILGLGDAVSAIPPEVEKLAAERAEARKAKNFALSDTLRGSIEKLGWRVKDTAKGQELTPV